MLDVGTDLEPEISKELHDLRQSTPQEWPEETLQRIKGPMKATTGGVPLKYLYGSDYPYRGLHEHCPIESHEVEARISHAKGGFSSIWGAAVLPYLAADIEDWPISVEQLAPYYQKVLGYVPFSAVSDGLQERFPLYAKSSYDLRPSPQAALLLDHMRRHQPGLLASGIMSGRARLAIRDNCTYCRMCLYGCPYGLIYNSADTIDDLRKGPRFHYQPGSFVDRVEECDGKVRIFVRSQEGERILDSTAVFIGCGTLGTARIMLKSKPIPGTLCVKDSHRFHLPVLQWKGAKNVDTEPMHTMSQIFLELFDPQVSRYTVHLQLYTYNDLYMLALRDKLGALFRLVKRPLRLVSERLSIIFVYVHSEESASMTMRLDGDKVVLESIGRAESSGIDRRIIRKLTRARKDLGFVPVGPMMKPASTGRGNHHGGTFPMSKTPDERGTDLLGRPRGFERVHLVDASTFPTVPATTITLTIMANAYRIGTECEIPE